MINSLVAHLRANIHFEHRLLSFFLETVVLASSGTDGDCITFVIRFLDNNACMLASLSVLRCRLMPCPLLLRRHPRNSHVH